MPTTAPRPRNTVRMLLVEDSPEDAALLVEQMRELTEPSVAVSVVSRLRGAIAMAQAQPFDVVVLDLGLPDSEGCGAVSAFRQALPHLPVVVRSGQTEACIAVEALRIGAQDYLVKGTCTGHEMVHALQRAMLQKLRIAERMAAVAREQLAWRDAKIAVKARDEFIHVASHELKTPITTMVMQVERLQLSLQRLRENVGPDDNAERLVRSADRVSRQVTRMQVLVEHLLDASRIGTGQLDLNTGEVDLRDLVLDVVSRLEDYGRSCGVALSFTSDGPAPGVWDGFRLEQVVVNLLTNAIKYGHGHPVEVRVHGEHTGQATLTVRDHGIGIAPHDQARIFGRFERAARGQGIEGLGLGLFIVRQIVTAHRGTIRVESEPGEGATFVVELPGAASPSPTDAD